MGTRVRIGVSSCLVGERLRYDGAHRRDPFVVDRLGAVADFVAVCPEVEAGMGVPRETVRLERDAERRVHLVGTMSGHDWTCAMQQFAVDRVRALAEGGLDGYVLKSRSPSCGLHSTPLFVDGAREEGRRGLFAAELERQLPLLPLVEEADLADDEVRLSFVLRAFARARLRGRARDLASFHLREHLLLLAHDPDAAEALAGLVGDGRAYRARFAQALAHPATDEGLVAAAHRGVRLVEGRLDGGERDALLSAWDAFVDEPAAQLPALVEVVRAVAWRHHVADVLESSYFDPEPLNVARGPAA